MATSICRRGCVWSLACLTSVACAAGRNVSVPEREGFAPSWDKASFGHDLWNQVLGDHVNQAGLVDYAAIKADERFWEYVHRLGDTDPRGFPTSDARLAFWINAYNALVIQGVLETLPDDRSRWPGYRVIDVDLPEVDEPGKEFFVGLRFAVGEHRYTLEEIEKAVLLQRWSGAPKESEHYAAVGTANVDPRIHFALVCAAKGCPKLRSAAYESSRVQTQLDDAVRDFARDRKQVTFDLERRRMRGSKLLEWYGGDLTNARYKPHAESVAAFLARYVDDGGLARSLTVDHWETSFIEYDWRLNLRR